MEWDFTEKPPIYKETSIGIRKCIEDDFKGASYPENVFGYDLLCPESTDIMLEGS